MIQKIKCVSLLLSVIIFGSGCATTGNYERALRSWIGHDINDLVHVWGYPTKTFEAPNGNTVYVYERGATGVTPTYTTPTNTNIHVYGNTAQATTTGGQTYGGYQVTYWCNTFFETDSSKRIIFWRWEGNSCVSQ